jgi:hypothetical protein
MSEFLMERGYCQGRVANFVRSLNFAPVPKLPPKQENFKKCLDYKHVV